MAKAVNVRERMIDILKRSRGPVSVSVFPERIGCRKSAVSYSIAKLLVAGMVKVEGYGLHRTVEATEKLRQDNEDRAA